MSSVGQGKSMHSLRVPTRVFRNATDLAPALDGETAGDPITLAASDRRWFLPQQGAPDVKIRAEFQTPLRSIQSTHALRLDRGVCGHRGLFGSHVRTRASSCTRATSCQ